MEVEPVTWASVALLGPHWPELWLLLLSLTCLFFPPQDDKGELLASFLCLDTDKAHSLEHGGDVRFNKKLHKMKRGGAQEGCPTLPGGGAYGDTFPVQIVPFAEVGGEAGGW